MYNNLKIDLLNTIQNNKSQQDKHDISESHSSFRNILDTKLKDLSGKDNLIDHQKKIQKKSSEHDKKNDAKQPIHKSISQNTEEDNVKKIPESDPEKEIAKKKDIKNLIITLHDVIVNILKDLPESNNDAADLKSFLKDLQFLISNMKKNINNLKKESPTSIFNKLNLLLEKHGNKKEFYFNKEEVENKFAYLQKHLNKLNRALSKNSKNNDKLKQLKDDNIHLKSKVESSNISTETHKEDTIHSKTNEIKIDLQILKSNTVTSQNNAKQPILNKTTFHNEFTKQFNSIIHNAKVFIRDNKNGNFFIKLHPAHLGKVNVNLGLEQGLLTAKFLVESSDAKNILLENISIIKEKLEEVGIPVKGFNVNVRGEEKYFQGNNQKTVTIINEDSTPLINTEYEINSSYNHNGLIDMII